MVEFTNLEWRDNPRGMAAQAAAVPKGDAFETAPAPLHANKHVGPTPPPPGFYSKQSVNTVWSAPGTTIVRRAARPAQSNDSLKHHAAGFFFDTGKRDQVNWQCLAPVDLGKIRQNLDVDELQRHLKTIVFADPESITTTGLADEEFRRLFRVLQLILEYLLYMQQYWVTRHSDLQNQMVATEKAADEVRGKVDFTNSEIETIKAEIRASGRAVQTYKYLLDRAQRQTGVKGGQAHHENGQLFPNFNDEMEKFQAAEQKTETMRNSARREAWGVTAEREARYDEVDPTSLIERKYLERTANRMPELDELKRRDEELQRRTLDVKKEMVQQQALLSELQHGVANVMSEQLRASSINETAFALADAELRDRTRPKNYDSGDALANSKAPERLPKGPMQSNCGPMLEDDDDINDAAASAEADPEFVGDFTQSGRREKFKDGVELILGRRMNDGGIEITGKMKKVLQNYRKSLEKSYEEEFRTLRERVKLDEVKRLNAEDRAREAAEKLKVVNIDAGVNKENEKPASTGEKAETGKEDKNEASNGKNGVMPAVKSDDTGTKKAQGKEVSKNTRQQTSKNKGKAGRNANQSAACSVM